MLRRILALATLLAAGLLGAPGPGANVASEQIAGIKKVYVEKFGGGAGADQIRDMVIAAIQRTNLFVLTENPERADTLLRGSAEDLVYTENFQSNEGITARLTPYGSTSSESSRTSAKLTAGVSIGDHDSVHQQERKHEASASVRLVNRDGDVIWSTIQESQGAKFRSAAADVAERIGRQLAADYAKVLERRVVATVGGTSGE
jgi:hypothetical protein